MQVFCTLNDHFHGRFKMYLNCTALQSAVLQPRDYDVEGIEVQFGAQCDVCSILSVFAIKLSFPYTMALWQCQVSEDEWYLHADVL